MHASPLPIVRAAGAAFRPPRRIRVSEAVHDTLVIRRPGGYSGPWDPREAPYMIEPLDTCASRRHQALCFVGPAQTGKTMALIDGWTARNVTCDPGDMLIVQMSQEKSREFSRTRIDRAIRHSPALRGLMSLRGHDDNTHDKLFKHGMWLKLGWPSATQLASSDYRYVALTDYDRYPDDIEGEGAAFPMALKRTQTFLSRGMCVVESSPGHELEKPAQRFETPHEAPSATGILGIYNTSDRRRWYWQCFDCRAYFEAKPGLDLFALIPEETELAALVRAQDLGRLATEYARVVCPECGSIIEPRHKRELNNPSTARWVPDGQTVDVDGNLHGQARESSIAGFWLGGVAAAYQSWRSLVLNYLQALRDYELTGDEKGLKSTTTLDQGMPYTPRILLADREARLEDRVEALDRFKVPDEARFLVAAVDVQGGASGRFVVEIRAVGPHLESWIVDRYSIRQTERHGKAAQVDPAGYPEDWDLLTEKVVQATYKTSGELELGIYRVAVDHGGEAGVSQNAEAWFRRLRELKLSHRVRLLKGRATTKRTAGEKPVVESFARDRRGRRLKDVPILLVDTNYFKDIAAGQQRRKAPGPGYFHVPEWLPPSYFDELRAEVRQVNGSWKQVRARNEAIDQWVQWLAFCEFLGCGAKSDFDWDAPPPWALPVGGGANSELVTPGERRAAKAQSKQKPTPRKRKGVGRGDWNSRL